MGKYRAAMARYSYLIRNYPDMGQYNEALEYIRRCKEKLSKERE
jgi:outer membrane protein assembly factor BamD (BamD/ComL family)